MLMILLKKCGMWQSQNLDTKEKLQNNVTKVREIHLNQK